MRYLKRCSSRMAIAMVVSACAAASPLLAQDDIWEHQQRVQAQQAEERRMNDIAMELNGGVIESSGSGETSYAPNSFVSFPPEAWSDWVSHAQDQHRQEIEARFANDPAYHELLKGTWTFRNSAVQQSLNACEATFWTRNGGVSFIHFAGRERMTLLGFFGGSIPSSNRPHFLNAELVQSGEVQRVRVLNLHFGSVKSMGMVLFNVPSPEALLGAIEDKQDFEVRLEGETVVRGEWHSGIKARAALQECLKGQEK